MKRYLKKDILLCLIISLSCIVYIYVRYFLFKNEILFLYKNLIEYSSLIIFFIILNIYFYVSKNNYIIKNLIFIVINYIVLLIGFDLFYRYIFKFAGKYKISAFFSFGHVEYIARILIFIVFFSLIASLSATLIKLIKKAIINRKSKNGISSKDD